MKAQNNQLNNKAMIGEVIRLLLLIYNMNKQQLNRDNVMTVRLFKFIDKNIIESDRW